MLAVVEGANKIYPPTIQNFPCCPNQKCSVRLDNGDSAEGIIKEQFLTRIILRETNDTDSCLDGRKAYEKIKVKVAISCNCLYAPITV